ncbi:MAG: SCO family protein [Aureliella sp.]
MRYWIGLAFMLVGIIVIYATRPSSDVAGRAYVETEDGTLELSDGTRPAQRTKPGALDDGSQEEWLKKWLLTERSGEPMGSEELKGQPYVAGFFFSTCPSICVQQNAKMKKLQDEFRGEPVRLVAISCDPEVDQPDVLQRYAERFDADKEQWLFFTGNMKYIRRVGSEYFSLPVERKWHPEKFVLVDKDGKPYGLYTWSEENQWGALIKDMKKMIAAGGSLEEETSGEDSGVLQADNEITAEVSDEEVSL